MWTYVRKSLRVLLLHNLHWWFFMIWLRVLDEVQNFFWKVQRVQKWSGEAIRESIKTLQSDWGDEYVSFEFLDYLKDNGIKSQWTPPETPQRNGKSERSCMYLNMVWSMMSYTDMPVSFWGYALLTIVYLCNRIPSKSVTSTPYEIWNGKELELSKNMGMSCNGQDVGRWQASCEV